MASRKRNPNGIYDDLLERIRSLESKGLAKDQVMAHLMQHYAATRNAVNSAYYRQTRETYWRGKCAPAEELLEAAPQTAAVSETAAVSHPDGHSWAEDFRQLLSITERLLNELIELRDELAKQDDALLAQHHEMAQLREQLKKWKEEPDSEELRRRFRALTERATAHLPGLAQTGSQNVAA